MPPKKIVKKKAIVKSKTIEKKKKKIHFKIKINQRKKPKNRGDLGQLASVSREIIEAPNQSLRTTKPKTQKKIKKKKQSQDYDATSTTPSELPEVLCVNVKESEEPRRSLRFAERMAKKEAQSEHSDAESITSNVSEFYCGPCKKQFANISSYNNHKKNTKADAGSVKVVI